METQGIISFLWKYTVFLFVLIEVMGLIGGGLISGVSTPVLPLQPTALDWLGFIAGQFGTFFALMSASSSFAILGAIIFTPAMVCIIYIIIQIVLDIIPF